MENPTLWLAFLAGVAYFFSPCTLPLIPSYLVTLSGFSLPEMVGRKRVAVFLHGLSFLLGFLFLFVSVGASATFLGNILSSHLVYFQKAGGLVIILFGLLIISKPSLLYRLPTTKSQIVKQGGLFGSFLVGLSFSAAWTGCSSPILAAILATAAVSKTIRRGISLLLAFSAGFAIPFLAITFFLNISLTALRYCQRSFRALELFLGILFVALGLRLILVPFPLTF